MDLAENRFGKTWKHFLEVLKVDYNCSLADVCRDQHTTFGGMSSWMSRRGYSVKQAKADVVRDYYGGVEPSQPTTSSPSFTQIAPAMLSEEEFSLAGITITFNSGTTISVKRATPGGVINRYYLYQGFVRMNLGIDGLFKIIRSEMKDLSPVSGDIFLFFGKNRQSVKILRWDGDGFLLYYKRLEGGSFELPTFNPNTGNYEISYQVLSFILNGVSLKSVRLRKRFRI